jgi:hypothetical protein
LALIPDIGARVNGLFGFGGKYAEERHRYAAEISDQDIMVQISKELVAHDDRGAEHGVDDE